MHAYNIYNLYIIHPLCMLTAIGIYIYDMHDGSHCSKLLYFPYLCGMIRSYIIHNVCDVQ